MHISRAVYTGMGKHGMFRVPMTLHVAYCGLKGVREVVSDNQKTDCDECFQAKAWEEIDATK